MTREQIERQLSEEITDLRRIMETVALGDFTGEVVVAQYDARLEFLESALRGLIEPRLDVTFGGDSADQHRVPARFLARVVGRLQQSVTRTGWSFHSGAVDEREPPVPIQRALSLDVVAVSPSSFRITFQNPLEEDLSQQELDLRDPRLLETSIGALLSLFEAAQSEHLTEETEELARRIGKGAAKSVQRLLGDLADSGMSTRFNWAGEAERSIDVSPDTAGRLRDWLRSVEERTEEIRMVGTLHGGDDLVGRFIFEDLGGTVYEGRAEPDVMAGKRITETYEAVIEVVTAVADHTGVESHSYVLRALHPDPRRRDE